MEGANGLARGKVGSALLEQHTVNSPTTVFTASSSLAASAFAKLEHWWGWMGLEGGRIACTCARETSTCRPPNNEENTCKPLAVEIVVFPFVEIFTWSWFPCHWGTLPDADSGRAREAKEGWFAVVSRRMLPHPLSWGEGLAIIALSSMLMVAFYLKPCLSPLLVNVPATTSCLEFREGAWSAC